MIIVLVAIVAGYFVYQNLIPTSPSDIQPTQQTPSINESKDDKIYSIQEMRDSNLPEGQYVKVRGKVSCIALNKVRAGYEGPACQAI